MTDWRTVSSGECGARSFLRARHVACTSAESMSRSPYRTMGMASRPRKLLTAPCAAGYHLATWVEVVLAAAALSCAAAEEGGWERQWEQLLAQLLEELTLGPPGHHQRAS